MTPALGVAMVVVGGCLAMVFDRLWQDAAEIELQTAAEAAALAAAHRLVDDETLHPDADWPRLLEQARIAAADVAGRNRVGGEPLRLSDSADSSDIQFGRFVVNDAGEELFVETPESPRTVRVWASQGRGSANPVGLLVRDLTGAGRDMTFEAAADLDNRVVGVRPYDEFVAPGLPLAVLDRDPAGARSDTWSAAIELRKGGDAYSYDAIHHRVDDQPDGLPELTVRSADLRASVQEVLQVNLQMIDVGAGLSDGVLVEQIEEGWGVDDLVSRGGELRFDGRPEQLPASVHVQTAPAEALQQVLGEARLCLLFDAFVPTGGGRTTTRVSRLVGVRIMAARVVEPGEVELVLQPAVVATRTAIVSSLDGDLDANPYVYKVYVSR